MNKQVIYGILAAIVGLAVYFFRDKLFDRAADVDPVPVCDMAIIKSSVLVDSVTKEKVTFRVVLEAKKDVEITSLRAYYVEKRNTRKTEYGVGNRARTKRTVSSEELGNVDLTDGKLSMKAGEKKEISAYFTLNEIKGSHYVEITGIADEPCPPDMDISDCIQMQVAKGEKNPELREIYMLERLKK